MWFVFLFDIATTLYYNIVVEGILQCKVEEGYNDFIADVKGNVRRVYS